MPKINLLDRAVAELIAAGEVVERPASVIKELVENSIDAGADVITVEIQRGGITYIRVTDNGCGISFEDVPTAFLRHATSKIETDTDLDSIVTLGFRGEALAAVSSVARVEMLTATEDSVVGTHYRIEGGQEYEHEETGCPKGTTITIKDLFFNTPARMKFLKKDVSEANACAAVIDRIALSHPEISFKFIRDGKLTLTTTGNGDVKGTVYSVLGREFSATLIDVNSEIDGITVAGLTCKPVACRPTRNNQLTFLNGRLVRSGTVVAAAEQAYKNSAMIGKFPGFVLYITVPYDTVDVNVHPAKTEVRFSDEKRIFNAVYGAIKAALTAKDTRPEVKLNKPAFSPFRHVTIDEYRQQRIGGEETVAERIYKSSSLPQKNNNTLGFRQDCDISFRDKFSYTTVQPDKGSKIRQEEETPSPQYHPERDDVSDVSAANKTSAEETKQPSATFDVIIEKEPEEAPVIKIIGEAFSTYIVAEMGDSIFMIDKHAAHERILFNKLSKERKVEIQVLLTPISVTLAKEEYDALIQNTELLLANGFEIEDFGNSAVTVRAIPSFLTGENLGTLLSEIASKLLNTQTVQTEREEHILHTVACRAAIKAGQNTSLLEMQKLAEKVLTSQEIMYCPHGRPVAFEIKKRELEKQFGRIQ